jgi:hypothetical protein
VKLISEQKGIEKLSAIREEFRDEITERFELRATPCSTCNTPCCVDEHFVNVRISRLEAAAIRKAVTTLSTDVREAISERLSNIDPASEFYSCPLYQRGVGCLVHKTAKPLPCIAHACYERKEDLPPDELLSEREIEMDALNRQVYGRSQPQTPIHAALR